MASRRVPFIPLVLAFVVGALLAASCALVDPPALVVNGQVLTSDEMFAKLSKGRPTTGTSVVKEFKTSEIAEFLTTEVYTNLVDQEFARRNLTVTAADRDTVEQLIQKKVTEDVARQFVLARAIVLERFANGQLDKAKLMQESYDSVKGKLAAPAETCFHVIITATEDPTADQEKPRREAAAAKARLATESFEKVADEVSLAKETAPGGNAGCQADDKLRPEIVAALAPLPIGVVSDPAELGGAFAVLRVDERKPGGVAPPLDSIRDKIETAVVFELAQKILGEWLPDAAKNAQVSVNARYGTWDAATTVVVPPDGAAKPTVPTSALPAVSLDPSVLGGPGPGAGPPDAGAPSPGAPVPGGRVPEGPAGGAPTNAPR